MASSTSPMRKRFARFFWDEETEQELSNEMCYMNSKRLNNEIYQ